MSTDIVWKQRHAPSWALMRLSRRTKIDIPNTTPETVVYTYNPNALGKGVSIFVFDTGVDKSHEDFEDRVVYGFNAFEKDDIPDHNPTDIDGHGTEVAGAIAGKKHGVANEARIISVKVIPSRGASMYSSASNIINGLDWVLKYVEDEKLDPSMCVVNISINAARTVRRLNTKVAEVARKGITVVVAAGNMGRHAEMSSPAGDGTVITVGATDIFDRLMDISNHGDKVDIFAPAQGVVSTAIASPTSDPDRRHSTTRTVDAGSTSLACAYASGVVACLLSSDNPKLKDARENNRNVPEEVKQILIELAEENSRLTLREKHLNSETRSNRLLYNGAPEVAKANVIVS